jgi:hypothetical protein
LIKEIDMATEPRDFNAIMNDLFGRDRDMTVGLTPGEISNNNRAIAGLCSDWFHAAIANGDSFLIVAVDEFESKDALYPSSVRDPNKFWDKFAELDDVIRMQMVLKIFKTSGDAPSFNEQFAIEPEDVMINPARYGFPVPRPGMDAAGTVPPAADGPK